jgi:hypothetical protein
VNGNEIDTTLEQHYLMLLGLDNQYDISPETIKEAFLNKVELLYKGGVEGEDVYLNELKAGREFLLDTCELRGSLN